MRFPRTIFAALILALVSAASTAAQSVSDRPVLATWYQPGNLAFPAGAGLALADGVGIGIYPGFELFVSKFRALGLASLDLAVGARAELQAYTPSLDGLGGSSSVSIAPVVTLHGGFRGLVGALGDLLEPVDYYTGLGLGFQVSRSGGVSSSGLTLVNVSGANYFLTDNLAVSLGTTLFASFGGQRSGSFATGIGIVYKVGPPEEPGRGLFLPDLGEASDALIYASFASLVWVSSAFGGYLPADDSFAPGDSVTVEQRFRDGREQSEIRLFRALLARVPEGSWWRYEIHVDGETTAFEALVDADGLVQAIRFQNPGVGAVEVIRPSDPQPWGAELGAAAVSESELAQLDSTQQTITVPAGTYATTRVSGTVDGGDFTWWLSDEVPGRMVQFSGQSQDGSEVRAELVAIGRGYQSPWPRAW